MTRTERQREPKPFSMEKGADCKGETEMIRSPINLLTPIFLNLGVSPNDISSYAGNVSGYVYASPIPLVMVRLVIIKIHHVVFYYAGLVFVLVVDIIANMICFGPMCNNPAPILNGKDKGKVSIEVAAWLWALSSPWTTRFLHPILGMKSEKRLQYKSQNLCLSKWS